VSVVARMAPTGEGVPAEPARRLSPIRADGNTCSHKWWCVLAFASLGLASAQASDSWLGQLDQAVIAAITRGRSTAAVAAARWVSALAEPKLAVFPLASAIVFALRRSGWRPACGPSLSVAVGMAIRRGLSSAIARQRPPAELWLTEPEGYSLPSKHTSLAALTAGACAAALGAGGLVSQAAALLAAADVGSGRVYLGVHWPSDILAGWLFAAGWLRLAEVVLPASAPSGARPHVMALSGNQITALR
jgi:membrane-associated phospholipid phosphatase